MKKIGIISILILIIILLITFNFNKKPKTITTLNYYSNQTDTKNRKKDEKLIYLFERKYKFIKVRHTLIDKKEYKNNLNDYINSKESPDILISKLDNTILNTIDPNSIKNIDNLWNKNNLNKYFYKALKKTSQIKSDKYLLPFSINWYGIYYNKNLFDKYNLKEPKTWEDFLNTCEILKENNIQAISLGSKYLWTASLWFDYINMRLNGADFHEKLLNGKIKYTDKKIKKAIEYFLTLNINNYFSTDSYKKSWKDSVKDFKKGKKAMILGGNYISESISNKTNYSFFKFPEINKRVKSGEIGSIDVFMIPKNSEKKEEAEKFLAFISKKKNQEKIFKNAYNLPSNMKVKHKKYKEEKNIAQSIMEETNSIFQLHENQGNKEMAQLTLKSLVKLLESGSIDSIEETCNYLEENRIRIFK